MLIGLPKQNGVVSILLVYCSSLKHQRKLLIKTFDEPNRICTAGEMFNKLFKSIIIISINVGSSRLSINLFVAKSYSALIAIVH